MVKVSVIMGVYNGEKYLKESIESILNQTYKDFEFVICDDGSSDASTKIIEKYSKLDSRIILLTNKINKGLAASLNECIKCATGEYIARMDCDDIAFANRFEKQVSYLDSNKNVAFVGSAANMFDDNGVWGVRTSNMKLSKEVIFKYHPIIHPTTMIRKSVLDDVGGYTVDKYTFRTEDFDLWCKIYMRNYEGEILKDTLLNYREDKNSFVKRKYKYRVDEYKLKKIWRKRLGLPLIYESYCFIPLIKGLVPSFIIKGYHKSIYTNNK